MSEIMNAVLRMPPTCWDNGNPIDEAQRHRIYVEAANLIETLRQQPTLSQLIDGLRLEWGDEFANVEHDGEMHSVHLQSDVATPLGDYRVIGNDCYVSIGENRWRQIAAGESRDNAKMLGELDYKQRVRAIFKGV